MNGTHLNSEEEERVDAQSKKKTHPQTTRVAVCGCIWGVARRRRASLIGYKFGLNVSQKKSLFVKAPNAVGWTVFYIAKQIFKKHL